MYVKNGYAESFFAEIICVLCSKTVFTTVFITVSDEVLVCVLYVVERNRYYKKKTDFTVLLFYCFKTNIMATKQYSLTRYK